MTQYICQKCKRINVPEPPATELFLCHTCLGPVEVVSDVLPFGDLEIDCKEIAPNQWQYAIGKEGERIIVEPFPDMETAKAHAGNKILELK